MKIIGSKNDVLNFFNSIEDKKLKCRVYEIDIYEENFSERYIEAFGECAWSVYSAMIEYPEFMAATKNLTIEIYGSEPGCGFQEHYIIKDGKITEEKTEDYIEIYEDNESELKDLIQDLNCSVDQLKKQMDEHGCISVGGIDNFGEFSI